MLNKDQIIQLLVEQNAAPRKQVQGCSQHEVKELENAYKVNLPQQYREFLLAVGHKAGEWLQGIDIFYECLLRYNLTQEAQALLDETKNSGDFDLSLSQWDFELPEDAFVFCQLQGITFLYFIGTEGDDPPIYQYHQGNLAPKKQSETFSEFLESIIKSGYISILLD